MLSRTGHGEARRALYMPGLVAKRHNPVIVAMAKRLEQKGLAPKAIVGASMRKLVHMIYAVLKSGRRFDARIPMQALAIQDGSDPPGCNLIHPCLLYGATGNIQIFAAQKLHLRACSFKTIPTSRLQMNILSFGHVRAAYS